MIALCQGLEIKQLADAKAKHNYQFDYQKMLIYKNLYEHLKIAICGQF